jgi:hypothetical protein
MGRSNSTVSAWNVALFNAGHTKAVETENEAGPAGEQCRLHWENCLEAVLEVYPWPFARKQVALSTPSGVTRTGWENVYALPADCVTAIALLPEDTRLADITEADRYAFDIMVDDAGTGHILVTDASFTDEDFEVLEYTSLVTTVKMWPRTALEAATFYLASKLAYSLIKDFAKARELYQMFRLSLGKALEQAYNNNRQKDFQQPTTPGMAARG